MKTRQLLTFLFLLNMHFVSAQQTLVQAGPMLGYAELKEVLLWIQTTESAQVQFIYWEKDSLNTPKYSSEIMESIAENAFTNKAVIKDLKPGTTYQYDVLINGQTQQFDYPTEFETQVLWQWRSDPPDFKIALGSCAYMNEPAVDRPGRGYGGDYHIFETIQKKEADLMLWLGDNIYFREVDWYTRTGMMHRYTHSRSLPELQALLATSNHYAIWDDHDFGPNDSDRGFIHKDKAQEVFELFWGNPTVGIPQTKGEGITTHFQWNDVDFFLLDNRYFRSPNNCKTCEPTILGKEQLNWLIDALVSSKATFKMVCLGGQVLNTAEVYEVYSHHHKTERDYLLQRIESEGIKNVIFLDGDRHHTELSKITDEKENNVYDFTVSPLTSGSGSSRSETNANRVEETLVVQRNFGIIEVTGARNERQATLRVFDVDGKELWNHTIEAQ